MRVTFATTYEERALPFVCQSEGCNFKGTACVHGIGEGGQSSLNSRGTANRRAEADLEKDFRRVLSVSRCPACGHRDREAVKRWWTPHFGWGIGVGALVAIFAAAMSQKMKPADRPIALWISFGLFVFFAAITLGSALWKWTDIPHRVRIEAELPSTSDSEDEADSARAAN
jgi:hypothetical protein